MLNRSFLHACEPIGTLLHSPAILHVIKYIFLMKKVKVNSKLGMYDPES